MDYERIHKVERGVISPSKLRMKLLGAHNSKRKEGGSNSPRTSPSKHEDIEFAMNLLTSNLEEEAGSKDPHGASAFQAQGVSEDPKLEMTPEESSSCHQGNQMLSCTKDFPKDRADTNRNKNQNNTRGIPYQVQSGCNLSTVHPVRSLEEDGNGYDSGHDNGSTSSFEFHRGERAAHHSVVGPHFRHVPSKWNDAEKWIVNRQALNSNVSKKMLSQSQGGRPMIPNCNWGRIAPESMISDTKRIDSTNSNVYNPPGKFSFVPHCLQPKSVSANGASGLAHSTEVNGGSCNQPNFHKGANQKELPVPENPVAETAVQSVSMRDVGTEMTPIPSQDPSRTGTPLGATTPTRSPLSSKPSSPRRGETAPFPIIDDTFHETDCQKSSKPEFSEKELRLKTRREIAALGMQLGKMNIASWASKDDAEHASPSVKSLDMDRMKAEYEARAAAWEEAEKAKHIARYKREEVKIQAWESHQKAKFEAEMRKLEVQVAQMRAQVEEKVMEKLARTRQQVEEKRANAEVRKSQQAARTVQKVEQIRQTGQVPPTHFRCCSWFL